MSELYNPSANAYVEVGDLGIEIQPQQIMDITYIARTSITKSNDLRNLISNATLSYVKTISNGTVVPMTVEEGLELINLGVTGTQVGINKPTRPGIIRENYYGVPTDSALIPDLTPANHLNAIPVSYMDRYFDRIGVCVTTAVANSVIRLGVYANNRGVPGELLLDAGVVPGDTIGNKEIVINFRTPNDWVFLATHTSHEIEFKSVTSQGSPFGTSGDDLVDHTRHFHADLTYTGDPLPSVFPVDATPASTYPPFVWFRQISPSIDDLQ